MDRGRSKRFGTLLIGLCVLAACTSEGAVDGDTTTSGPIDGDDSTLVVAVEALGGGDFDTKSNPDDVDISFVGVAFLDTILTVAPGGGPAPGIAETWDVSEDSSTWTLNIREGATFHDGSRLAASDVVFSLQRAIEDDSLAINAERMRSIIESISLVDDSTVEIALSQPDPEFWALLTPAQAGSEGFVLPEVFIEENGIDAWKESPIGSGPWKLESFQNGVRYDFERNSDYWGSISEFESLTVLVVPEEATRLSMLEAGEADVVYVNPDTAASIGDRVQLFEIPAAINTTYGLWGHWEEGHPFNDARVREALSIAIDREQLANELLAGFSSPAGAYMSFPSNDYYDPDVLAPDPFDPERARELLAESGFEGFATKIYASEQAGADIPTMAQALAGFWSEIGVEVEIVPIDHEVIRGWYNSGLPTPEELVGNVSFWVMGAPLTTVAFHLVHSSEASVHQSRFEDLDAAIASCTTAVNVDERRDLCLEAAEISHDKYVLPGLLYHSAIMAVSEKVGDFTPVPGSAYPGPYTSFVPQGQ